MASLPEVIATKLNTDIPAIPSYFQKAPNTATGSYIQFWSLSDSGLAQTHTPNQKVSLQSSLVTFQVFTDDALSGESIKELLKNSLDGWRDTLTTPIIQGAFRSSTSGNSFPYNSNENKYQVNIDYLINYLE